ncbi:tRNA-dihydrouridine(20) synthase [NAD(P)+]-like isoform X2 [Hylaeus volcanicus]|uniref:tRNA-dihydrouridine(20) synthase [NAD(P)+]-like isoform X2 n=1 Tax=Hylaeus volcanicus TaxID=313075 RepID=UPI0023B7DCED|nr:tRNA-dihydrouridine(20) synthase [NAD(P)+]-like isoform X2 [Hylaeus volcanicus]
MEAFQPLWIAGPMIKVSYLPFRLTCLDYGADLIYTNEIMAENLCLASRNVNALTNTIDFVIPNDKTSIFSTSPEERHKVVVQLGVSNASVALKSSLIVSQDTDYIDINMGCPKRFSMSKGMGASLLNEPERAFDILKVLRRNLPEKVKISCKIRLKSSLEQTIAFVQGCERSGVSSITIHARSIEDRPAKPAQWNTFSAIQASTTIPIYMNGDLLNSTSIYQFHKQYLTSPHDNSNPLCDSKAKFVNTFPQGIMFARGALMNPSIFSLKKHFQSVTHFSLQERRSLHSPIQCILKLLKHALDTNTPFQCLKWLLLQMVSDDPSLIFLSDTIKRTSHCTRFQSHVESLAQSFEK